MENRNRLRHGMLVKVTNQDRYIQITFDIDEFSEAFNRDRDRVGRRSDFDSMTLGYFDPISPMYDGWMPDTDVSGPAWFEREYIGRGKWTVAALPGDWHVEERITIEGVEFEKDSDGDWIRLGSPLMYIDGELAAELFPEIVKSARKVVVIDRPYVEPEPPLEEIVFATEKDVFWSNDKPGMGVVNYRFDRGVGMFNKKDTDRLTGDGELEFVVRRKRS